MALYLDDSQPIGTRVEDALSRMTLEEKVALFYAQSKFSLVGVPPPLNGRSFEYMGEDPYLASRIVVPYVQGVQANGVAACVKHYAVNNIGDCESWLPRPKKELKSFKKVSLNLGESRKITFEFIPDLSFDADT